MGGILRRRDRGEMGDELQNVLIHSERAARAGQRQLPRVGRQAEHHGPQHGRSWCAPNLLEKLRQVQVCISICSHLQPYRMPMGLEGVLWLPRSRQGSMEEL